MGVTCGDEKDSKTFLLRPSRENVAFETAFSHRAFRSKGEVVSERDARVC